MNQKNTVVYTGVTSDLKKRVFQHKQKLIPSFTSKYHLDKIVYYEVFDRVVDAIAREKQIKAGSREKKMSLIRKMNPQFEDLYHGL